jgi:hypothetical protein
MRNATLTIEGQTFYLLDFSYSFGVDTDRKGRPASTLYGGTFVVTMESTSNTDMFRWLFGTKSEYKTLVSGKIEVESLYDETIFKRFEFESAYISTGSMHFEVGSSEWPRMTETFSIVALRLDVNKFLRLDRRKYEYGFNWNTYVPEPEIPMFVRPEPRVYVTSVEGPATGLPNETLYYRATAFSSSPSDRDLRDVKWSVKVDNTTERLDWQGERIRLKMKEEWVGKQITVMAWLHSPDETVSATTKVVAHCVALFIGGAGDKESFFGFGPTYIVENEVRIPFDRALKIAVGEYLFDKYYTSLYVGYNEVYPVQDGFRLNLELDKSAYIYIIGHSLGGWNGAHLSRQLSKMGYKVEMLITLDPVGERSMYANDIIDVPAPNPVPQSKFWINIRANSSKIELDDVIAKAGDRWETDDLYPNINCELDLHHGQAGAMFMRKLQGNKSAFEHLRDSIKVAVE